MVQDKGKKTDHSNQTQNFALSGHLTRDLIQQDIFFLRKATILRLESKSFIVIMIN